MSNYEKEFKRFAKRRRFPKFIILGLMMLLTLGILSSAFGGRGRHGHGHHYDSEFRGHYSQYHQKGAANAPQPKQAAQATQGTQATQSNLPNEMLVLSNALVRSVQNRHITQEQADAVIAQELRRMMEREVSSNSASVQAPQAEFGRGNQGPQAEFEFNRGYKAPQEGFGRGNQAPQEGFRGEQRSDRRHHGGFSLLGFFIGGLFRLALLVLLLKVLSRFLGFKPWKRAQAGYRSACAEYEGWAGHEERPVDPIDDEIFNEEVPVAPEKQEPAKEEAAAEAKNEEAPKQEASPATVKLAKEESDSQADNAQAVEKDDKES
jgi:hypothetical protein